MKVYLIIEPVGDIKEPEKLKWRVVLGNGFAQEHDDLNAAINFAKAALKNMCWRWSRRTSGERKQNAAEVGA